MLIQIGNNKVTIEGTQTFTLDMGRAVLAALQTAPLGPPAAPKGTPKKSGGRRGRVAGRTIKGRYIKPGSPIRFGYHEMIPGGPLRANTAKR